ncbi:MAG: pseudouridine synthase [Planctomycetota bacterium]
MGESEEKGIRLQKYLARCGAGSRRACEALIEQGRVQVDGVVVRQQGTRVRSGDQEVRLDGEVLHPEKRVYYLVNKPKGYVCSNAATYAPMRVTDLIPREPRRLVPAGRLDKDSDGLVFLTNDGNFANRLMHPRYGVPKTYRAVVRGQLDARAVAAIRRGVFLAEGKTTPSALRILGGSAKTTEVEVILAEGRNREVRRIFAGVGYPVKSLRRVAIGPFRLGSIPPGRFKALQAEQVRHLIPDRPAGTGKGKRSRQDRRKRKRSKTPS